MSLDLVSAIRLACLLEATARKPGNVHPGARFSDLRYADFVACAEASAPHLAEAGRIGIGRSVLDAVTAARGSAGSNVNLGIALLIAPLAAVPLQQTLREGIAAVLREADAALVYEAIRLAQPGGLGKVTEQDVSQAPTISLAAAMALAADRDAIARQYASDFEDVLVFGRQALHEWLERQSIETSIIGLALDFLVRMPDSLIARKCGVPTAEAASTFARRVLATGWPDEPAGQTLLAEFDDWLRGDGHRRNPGTTADLVAATLFAAIREGEFPIEDGWRMVESSTGRGDQ